MARTKKPATKKAPERTDQEVYDLWMGDAWRSLEQTAYWAKRAMEKIVLREEYHAQILGTTAMKALVEGQLFIAGAIARRPKK